MGALTLKSFPFELRGWDIEKFESIDPTDGFGVNTRVYVSKQKIIQIEPNHGEMASNAWLTDKGRQFFDGITGLWKGQTESDQNFISKKSWQKNIKALLQTIYLFEHCTVKTQKTYFLTFVFENLGIETLSLLKLLEQKYSFIKLRKAEDAIVSNDLEAHFQLNSASYSNKLQASTLCLLIANNPRYEGSPLNLTLRQRYFKGNFKCLVLGSFSNLTFPSTTIGTNLKIVQKIAEGNQFTCQSLKAAKKPLIIFNNEINKRSDSKNVLEIIKTFQQAGLFTNNWNGLNSLNSTLSETGTHNIATFSQLKKNDFESSSSFYFLNVSAKHTPSIKKITELKLLGYVNWAGLKESTTEKLAFDQNNSTNNNQTAIKNLTKSKNYFFLPVKMFYENEETFINTEGSIKKTNKLITKRKTKEGWALLRNLMKLLKNQYTSLDYKNNSVLSFDLAKQTSFLTFNYCATKKLNFLAPISLLIPKTQPFFIHFPNAYFKQRLIGLKNTKSKYWLDDFFTGGKDSFSKNSLVLSNCSNILRTQLTNFF